MNLPCFRKEGNAGYDTAASKGPYTPSVNADHRLSIDMKNPAFIFTKIEFAAENIKLILLKGIRDTSPCGIEI
jgi:hypothetical protein